MKPTIQVSKMAGPHDDASNQIPSLATEATAVGSRIKASEAVIRQTPRRNLHWRQAEWPGQNRGNTSIPRRIAAEIQRADQNPLPRPRCRSPPNSRHGQADRYVGRILHSLACNLWLTRPELRRLQMAPDELVPSGVLTQARPGAS